jgi:hypothetical protein
MIRKFVLAGAALAENRSLALATVDRRASRRTCRHEGVTTKQTNGVRR